MSGNLIPYTYKCERCGIDKTIEIKVPKTCSKECRLFLLGERQKARKAARLQNQPMQEEQVNNTSAEPEVPQTNGEPTPQPTPEVPADNPGSEGDSGDIGQGTPGENPVESPSQPTENPGATEGQA